MNFYKIIYHLLKIYCKIFCFSPYSCVVGIIKQKNKILLIKHSDGKGYALPGGIVKYGETLEQALRREILEETGYKIRIIKQLRTISFTPSSVGTHNMVTVFETRILSGKLTPSSEGIPNFFEIKKLPELSHDARVILKKNKTI
jgi:8-oxo-dGTP diphosphatase